MLEWLYDQQGRIDWRWIATTCVALYAAVLASYREYVSRRERQPDIRVIFSTNMIALLGNQTVPHVQVRVENHGRPELTFDSNCVSLEWRNADDTRLLIWDDKITNVATWPHRLGPGASFYMMAKTEPLRDLLAKHKLPDDIELRAIVSDAIGRQFYSEWVTLPKRQPGIDVAH